ncbi:MAG: hypothetical protein AB7I38_01205 [Dehalococcoidia bacterium]
MVGHYVTQRRQALAALLLLAGMSVVLGGRIHAQSPIDAPSALERAIEAHVEAQGHEFAGDCRDAQTGEFAGQYCYTVTSLNEESAEVRIGQALSDGTTAVRFRNISGTWQVDAGTPTPSATATGTATATPSITTTPSAPRTGMAGLTGEQRGGPLALLSVLVIVGTAVGAARLLTHRA